VLLLALMIFPGCCVVPEVVFCCIHGSGTAQVDPGKVRLGMSRDDVLELFGRPHNTTNLDGSRESWTYYTHWIGYDYISIQFDEGDRVQEVRFPP
jgi:outer membrane protein assembly factor BamE (lipoprotein component of BamABCDE complex)